MEVFSPVNLYGALVLTIMMVFYALEGRNKRFTLYFGFACIFSSAYGFLSGTWPFGIIEIVWTGISFRKYFGLIKKGKSVNPT